MRKVILLFTVLFGAIYAGHAQFEYGVKGGLNIAKVDFSGNAYTSSSLIGFYGGVMGRYKLGEKMGVQADILYSSEGTKEKAVSAPLSGDAKETFVQIPLQFFYMPVENLFLSTGPQIGLLLAIKERFGPNGSSPAYRDAKQLYKSTDLRWCLGAGYDLDVVTTGLGAELRYSFSLSKVNDQPINGTSLKNKVISIGVYYMLSELKKKKK